MRDKDKGLDSLARYLGMFEADNRPGRQQRPRGPHPGDVRPWRPAGARHRRAALDHGRRRVTAAASSSSIRPVPKGLPAEPAALAAKLQDLCWRITSRALYRIKAKSNVRSPDGSEVGLEAAFLPNRAQRRLIERLVRR